jgi:aryl-alcohol dehydrogenase-like predicted oxidoreductase
MERRRLGESGLAVSAVGIGCNNFGMRIDEAQTRDVVAACLDLGIDFFDTADIYGAGQSELFLGRALGGHRHDVVVATKFGMPPGEDDWRQGGSRRYVMQAVEASLKRLGTDYIDLYQIHRPDPDTPVDETLRALDDLVRQGKVRYAGCSNFAGWQIADADWTARSAGGTRFVSAQNEYSLLRRGVEREVLPACDAFGLGFLPYFPLASGLLTGKYRRGEDAPPDTRLAHFGERGRRALNERNFDRIEALTEFARARGRSLLELAFGWLLANPLVSSVIAGATRVEQVAANVEATGWVLDADELAAVDALLREHDRADGRERA